DHWPPFISLGARDPLNHLDLQVEAGQIGRYYGFNLSPIFISKAIFRNEHKMDRVIGALVQHKLPDRVILHQVRELDSMNPAPVRQPNSVGNPSYDLV